MRTREPPTLDEAARSAGWQGWLRAGAVVGLCTGLCELLAGRLDLANLSMLYLAGVVYVALHEGRAVSAATVVASIFLFDLIFVPPRWGLNPLNPAHFITFAVMLAVGLLIGQLAEQARRQTQLAEARARRSQTLADLSAGLAAAATPLQVEMQLREAVRAGFGADCRLETLDGPSLSPDAGHVLHLTLQGAAGPVGRMSVQWPVAPAFRPEDRSLLDAFAHQAALALERCRFEQQSVQAQVQAEAERMRSTLLSGISHDFRTPLTTIVGAVSSLLEQDRLLDPAQRTVLLQGVVEEARRLHALVSNLLDLTRMQEGVMRACPEWCPADDLVAEALAAIGPRAGRHELQVDAPADAIVWCDPRLVEQALVNLVHNALQYTPADSRITITVAIRDAVWTLSVADTGPGLPPGAEEELLRPFRRGPAGASDGGTGLGLAICSAVARLHGGKLTASSGQGAVFTLTFPQASRAHALAEEPA